MAMMLRALLASALVCPALAQEGSAPAPREGEEVPPLLRLLREEPPNPEAPALPPAGEGESRFIAQLRDGRWAVIRYFRPPRPAVLVIIEEGSEVVYDLQEADSGSEMAAIPRDSGSSRLRFRWKKPDEAGSPLDLWLEKPVERLAKKPKGVAAGRKDGAGGSGSNAEEREEGSGRVFTAPGIRPPPGLEILQRPGQKGRGRDDAEVLVRSREAEVRAPEKYEEKPGGGPRPVNRPAKRDEPAPTPLVYEEKPGGGPKPVNRPSRKDELAPTDLAFEEKPGGGPRPVNRPSRRGESPETLLASAKAPAPPARRLERRTGPEPSETGASLVSELAAGRRAWVSATVIFSEADGGGGFRTLLLTSAAEALGGARLAAFLPGAESGLAPSAVRRLEGSGLALVETRTTRPYAVAPVVDPGFAPAGEALTLSAHPERRPRTLAQRTRAGGRPPEGEEWAGGALMTRENSLAALVVYGDGRDGASRYAWPGELASFLERFGLAYPEGGGLVRIEEGQSIR